MFSDHLRKIDQAPYKTLLLVACGVVIACQLAAMALLAGEQVQKAQMRSNSDVSRQAAVASCVEISRGVAVKNCFSLGSGEFEGPRDTDHAKDTGPDNMLSRGRTLDGFAATDRPVTPDPAVTGFTSTSFATR